MALRKLLLISPPLLFAKSWPGNRIANKPHLSSLAGYVRDLAEVEILELDAVADDGSVRSIGTLDDALGDSVGMVGISCWTSLHYLGAIAVAERVRRLAPEVRIVMGGHHATAAPADFYHSVCDWLVRGDGEHALRQLCEQWPARPDEMQILTGGVFDQSDPSHIDWENYGRPGETPRTLWMGTGRGCAFKCRFCVEPSRGPVYSRYSVEDTVTIIEGLLQTHEPEMIAFSDPLFGADRRWTEAFLEAVEERQLPLLFWAETRTDLMSQELLDRFKRCNFMLDFGLDTACRTMVERMEKAANPERYLALSRQTLRHADAIGLLHGIYVVFNFPGETPDTVRETQSFLEDISSENGPTACWLACQSFFILPGTSAFLRISENAEAYGTEIRNPAWWKREGDHHALATDVLPSREWLGQEHELLAFRSWNRDINARWTSRYPPEVQSFSSRFFHGTDGSGIDG